VRRAVQDKIKEGEELAGRLCGVSSLVLCSSGSCGHCPGAKGVAFDQRNLKVHNHIADCQADAGLRERCQSLEQFEYSFSAVSMCVQSQVAGSVCLCGWLSPDIC